MKIFLPVISVLLLLVFQGCGSDASDNVKAADSAYVPPSPAGIDASEVPPSPPAL